MRTAGRIFGVIGVIGTAQCALAQAPLELEEIVVSAQRRDESLRDVPISVVAIDSEAIERQNIKEAQDYLVLTPNVTFAEEAQGGSRSMSISIRGVSNISVLENRGGGSAIGYYFDEISLAQVAQGTANPQLIDIERVEVLRGPQGTFFGLNATGGAINLLTRKPDDRRSGELNVEAGSHEHWGASGIYNVPLTDKFFVRAVVSAEETPALVENANEVGGDSGSFNQLYRLSARYLPLDSLDILARVSYSSEKQGLEELVSTCRLSRSSQNLMSLDAGVRELGFPAPIPVGIDGYVNDGSGCFPGNDDTMNKSVLGDNGERDRELYASETLLASSHITYDAGGLQLQAISGYISTQVRSRFDLDGTERMYVNRSNRIETDAWSQEVRLSSTGPQFDWLVGAIYFDSSQERYNRISSDEERFFVFPTRATLNEFFQTTDIETYALFADASWHATDRLTLTAGGRYSDSESVQCAQNLSPGAALPYYCAPSASTTDFSPRAVVQMQWTPRINTYVSASRGYKPGGVQVEGTQYQGAYQPSYFDKETLWNYELGFKASLLDNRLLFNAAVFRMDWKNLQVDDTLFTVNPSTNATETSTNIRSARKAVSEGFELDFVARVADAFTLGGGVGYTDATFKDFDGTARPQGLGPIDLSGERIPGAPRWTGNLFGEYRFALAGQSSYVRAEVVYRDEVVPNLDGYFFKVTDPAQLGFIENDGNPYPFIAPEFTVVNLRMGTEIGNWRLIGYVENLFEEDYFTGARYGFNVSGVQVRPHPRQFGVKATFSW